jgi:hypothetical protein
MEPALLGVILDSSVLIDAERQGLNVARFLKHLAQQIGARTRHLSRGHTGKTAGTPRLSRRPQSYSPDLFDYRRYSGVGRKDPRRVLAAPGSRYPLMTSSLEPARWNEAMLLLRATNGISRKSPG